LNPFIYSLRNRDIQLAFGILYRKGLIFAKWETAHQSESIS
jgi:hypothetical protein